MGSFTFKWTHGNADEVFVTGTFDDWAKTTKLDKKGDIFEKTVELPKSDEKVLYKYVVDGKWTTDSNARQEDDGHNNFNNVLNPEDYHVGAAAISSAAPGSTTAQLAGEVPKAPGAFPETPAKEPESFSVNPIPATSGAGNPIKLAPGEKVPDPSTLTDNTIESTVRTDEASYNASDAGPAQETVKALDTQGGAFGVPPVTSNTIPESSLPIGSGKPESEPTATIQSAAPESTTAALAGAVPKETKGVPEVVKESQAEAHVDPEASGSPEAVKEKKAVEEELKSKVPEEQATDSKPVEGVPAVVTQSLDKAHQPHEAVDNAEAVAEKAAVEKELVKEHAPTDTAATGATSEATASTPQKAPETTPSKDTPSSAKSGNGKSTDKKDKRRSFFGKLKDKLKG